MFLLKQKVVYPGYGVAHISKILMKNIAEQQEEFYELSFLHKDMTILVPVQKATEVGLRPLSSEQDIETIFSDLSARVRPAQLTEWNNNWNRRYKEYQLRLRAGTLAELSEVYKDLKAVERQKKLSFGEQAILRKTETLIAEEMSCVLEKDQDAMIVQLRACSSIKKNVGGDGLSPVR